jgi:hypothetical protein
MLTRFVCTLFAACLLLGCAARVSKESKRLTELVSKNVTVGASEETVLRFFNSQAWKPKITRVTNYGDLYSLTFFDDADKGHSVIVEVWIKEGKVKSFRIFDAYTAL